MLHAYKEQGDHIMSWHRQWTLNNPVRALIQPPRKMFKGLVEPGMTVADTGCGTGFFSLALARLVGPSGKVIAVDLQAEALALLEEKADELGLADIIETWKCDAGDLGRLPEVDFGLSAYMAHETPDIDAYFRRMAQCVKPGGKLLLAEPRFHVSRSHFDNELAAAARTGFVHTGTPAIRLSHAAVLERA
ncbi:SAM-dependent methyltransferase [Pseudodesulfovibrio portus]|uniref:Arsenite methyltransferase n=1 Tax=Pseudodesulfovibrio portus TaxID=231439 RepID=A0ABM8AQY0_9BACT|nr:class I SAM-dependent methyltransferase [Pseudodesulfovibrio portus]BDQ33734.1 type 11 methyltransferase [Pseudodesulfovibrio portus]